MTVLKFKSKLYIKNVPTAKYKLINNIVQSGTTDLKTTGLKILTLKHFSRRLTEAFERQIINHSITETQQVAEIIHAGI